MEVSILKNGVHKFVIFNSKDEWLRARRGRITGTLAHDLYTGNYGALFNAWAKEAYNYENEYMRIGRELEPKILEFIGANPVEKDSLILVNNAEFLAASLDGFYDDGTVVEIKTTRLSRESLPKIEHVHQLLFYCNIVGSKRGKLVYMILDREDENPTPSNENIIEFSYGESECNEFWEKISKNLDELMQMTIPNFDSFGMYLSRASEYAEADLVAFEISKIDDEIEALQKRRKALVNHVYEQMTQSGQKTLSTSHGTFSIITKKIPEYNFPDEIKEAYLVSYKESSFVQFKRAKQQ